MDSKLSKKIGIGVMALLITSYFIPAVAGAFVPGDGRQDKRIERKSHHRSALGIWRSPQMVKDLGLTAEQVKQVKDADFSFREKRLALKAQLGSLRLKMDKAFSDEVVNETDILELAQTMSDLKGQLFVQKIEARLAVGRLLNAEQIEKIKQHRRYRNKKGTGQGKNRVYGHRSVENPDNAKRLEN